MSWGFVVAGKVRDVEPEILGQLEKTRFWTDMNGNKKRNEWAPSESLDDVVKGLLRLFNFDAEVIVESSGHVDERGIGYAKIEVGPVKVASQG